MSEQKSPYLNKDEQVALMHALLGMGFDMTRARHFVKVAARTPAVHVTRWRK